jgi:hypothetical protein
MTKKVKTKTLETEDDERITPINKTEILPLGTGMKLLRLDIPVSNEFLEVLTELCKIRQWDLKRYVTQTLHNGIELDLTSPQDIGMDVCKNLKEMIHPTGT